METSDYATYSKEQLEKEFSTSLAHGLTDQQVATYQKQYGPNAVKEHGVHWWSIFIRQFRSPFVYLLMIAVVISFFLHDTVNALTILAIIALNGLLSFYQEYKAEQALKLIQAHLTTKATVLRNGAVQEIDSKELVPGDIVLLKTGDYVPADIVLLEGSLTVNESVLTGESMPVKKSSSPEEPHPSKNSTICFSSTTVTEGSARGIVVATGSQTMFGEIGRLTLQTIRQSGFQERISRLSRFILSLVLLSLAGLLIFHLIIRGAKTDLIQLLLFAIALTIGITPEALPVVITFALSQGALELVRRSVVVKRLSAIEDLGAINVLCTDKTGTLTENNLSVSALYEEHEGLVLPYMLLASGKSGSGGPFDNALLKAASPEQRTERNAYTIIKEIPFNPVLRRNSVLVSKKDETILVSRGSFESIEKLSTALADKEALLSWIGKQEKQGDRVLAVAYKQNPNPNALDQEKEFTFVGLASFHDPIKPTTQGALLKANRLGITIKMITGDSPEVAVSVAHQIGLSENVITGSQFEILSLQEKQGAVRTYTLFARIVPQQKYEIVNLLKTDNVVGFVGEGINDAPALKASHVGLAVQGASDIARDAADIILLNSSLFAIIRGIGIGRNVFSNTMKYILAAISSTFGNCYSIGIASLLIDFLPLLPLQILLINLLSDLPMIAIATDTVDQDELRKPQKYDLGNLAFIATILGLTSSCFDFVTFALFYPKGPAVLRTNWFIESILTELALIYSVRTKRPFYKAKRPSFVLIGISILSGIITITLPLTQWGQKIFHFKAPEPRALLIIFAIVAAYFITTELVKLLYYRYRRPSSSPRKSHL